MTLVYTKQWLTFVSSAIVRGLFCPPPSSASGKNKKMVATEGIEPSSCPYEGRILPLYDVAIYYDVYILDHIIYNVNIFIYYQGTNKLSVLNSNGINSSLQ